MSETRDMLTKAYHEKYPDAPLPGGWDWMVAAIERKVEKEGRPVEEVYFEGTRDVTVRLGLPYNEPINITITRRG